MLCWRPWYTRKCYSTGQRGIIQASSSTYVSPGVPVPQSDTTTPVNYSDSLEDHCYREDLGLLVDNILVYIPGDVIRILKHWQQLLVMSVALQMTAYMSLDLGNCKLPD